MKRWAARRSARYAVTCGEIAQVLQTYLDGQVDEISAFRVARHLEACRRCGLEADTYLAIKEALARRVTDLDEGALARLRAFGSRLAEEGGVGEADSPA